MPRFRRAALALLALPFELTTLACLAPASAEEIRAGTLVIQTPWSRATPPGAEVAGGYMTIRNTGTAPDRLLGGSLQGAAGFEVHTMSTEGGIMRMRPVEDGLPIAPGASVVLKPAGTHIMYTGLQAPLKQGEKRDGTLVFQHAGTVPVQVTVESLAARQASGDKHDGMPMSGEGGQ